MAKLMVSVVNESEALKALWGGADIVDVKNPSEGALGAQTPKVIKSIRKLLPLSIEVSATLGDLPYLPGTASLAALGAAVSGVNYVKAGLFGVRDYKEAINLSKAIKEALSLSGLKVKFVVCGYADYASFGSISPLMLPLVAYRVEADGILIDIKRKIPGVNLFTYMDNENITKLVDEAHSQGLFVALAGGLGINDVNRCIRLGVDVVGLRRGLLLNGQISEGLVAAAARATRMGELESP